MEDYLLKVSKVIVDLVRVIQRLEKEDVDLTVGDIQTVWRAKTILGYKTPDSVEEGTGRII